MRSSCQTMDDPFASHFCSQEANKKNQKKSGGFHISQKKTNEIKNIKKQGWTHEVSYGFIWYVLSMYECLIMDRTKLIKQCLVLFHTSSQRKSPHLALTPQRVKGPSVWYKVAIWKSFKTMNLAFLSLDIFSPKQFGVWSFKRIKKSFISNRRFMQAQWAGIALPVPARSLTWFFKFRGGGSWFTAPTSDQRCRCRISPWDQLFWLIKYKKQNKSQTLNPCA